MSSVAGKEPGPVDGGGAGIRVLAVSPSSAEMRSMPFIHRQIASLERLGVRIRPFFLRSRTSVPVLCRELLRFRREVRDFQPDIVHAHFGTTTSLFCAMGTARPLVISFRGSDLNPAPGVRWARNRTGHVLSQLSALRAQRIVCVSDELTRRLWWRGSRAEVVPTGVNLDLFTPRRRDEARRALGWSPGEPIVLFNARTDPVGKGLPLAERAIGLARQRRPQLRFVVLRGETPPERMPLLYSAADCLLLTSHYEGSPNFLKEAMACNLPVVSVAVGDSVLRLRGVRPSSIVDRDPARIAAAVLEIVETPTRSNGRERIAEIAEERVARRILDVYRSMVRHRRNGDDPGQASRRR
jgi:glycosyltransferase involved in cell wall biosynthesis